MSAQRYDLEYPQFSSQSGHAQLEFEVIATLGSSSSRHLHYSGGTPSNQFRSVSIGHVHQDGVYPSMHLHVFGFTEDP
ncbi:MAG: hypothetical protein EZS28_027186 [Streblomastix strix]|uniref:Uncharacterized protein n=1 Tax=Streblomastix strix TaxID=222440 RepID=A0A5J4V2W5_9EUKA|nr:MAG: hypothetical protein EZS28_027186 [Streblomastix strix]